MASSPEKVQVDPEGSNKKKPSVGGLTALLGNTRRLDSYEDSLDQNLWMCGRAHGINEWQYWRDRTDLIEIY